MKNDGRNTASTLSIASSRGVATSLLASRTARGFAAPLRQMHVNVFEEHGSFVHQYTHCQGESAERHDVDGLPVAHRPPPPLASAKGIVTTTTNELRQSRKKKSNVKPVRTAPSGPSRSTASSASRTYWD